MSHSHKRRQGQKCLCLFYSYHAVTFPPVIGIFLNLKFILVANLEIVIRRIENMKVLLQRQMRYQKKYFPSPLDVWFRTM